MSEIRRQNDSVCLRGTYAVVCTFCHVLTHDDWVRTLCDSRVCGKRRDEPDPGTTVEACIRSERLSIFFSNRREKERVLHASVVPTMCAPGRGSVMCSRMLSGRPHSTLYMK